MPYRCVALSITGFIQQLAVGYLPRGYYFFVTGRVPKGKDPRLIDRKLIEKYEIDCSKWARARAKRNGQAGVQYLRHEDFFVLLATHGRHKLFEEEAGLIRDTRETPIRYASYAVSFRGGHAHVRIDQETLKDLKAYFLEISVHRSKESLETQLHSLPFEPYAPVRSQLLVLVRHINLKRRAAGFDAISQDCLRLRRHIVQPFGSVQQKEAFLTANNT